MKARPARDWQIVSVASPGLRPVAPQNPGAAQLVRSGVKSLLQNISVFRLREFEDARAAASLAMGVFTDAIKGEVEDQRRLRLDPMDIVNSPDFQAANLWFADGHPQPVFTAHTRPLPETPQMRAARAHHEREQRRRGYHLHDRAATSRRR